MGAGSRRWERMLAIGEVVHVIERRGFDGDLRRHFIGTVEQTSTNAVRATGYTFIFDSNFLRYERSREKRTRILSLIAPGLIINVAPHGTDVDKVRYVDKDGHLTATDSGAFSMSVNEFGPRH